MQKIEEVSMGKSNRKRQKNLNNSDSQEFAIYLKIYDLAT